MSLSIASDADEVGCCIPAFVAVGTANFMNPYATIDTIHEIETYMKNKKVNDIKELIGCVH